VLASLVLLTPSYLLAVSKHNSTEKELAVLEEKYGRGGQEKDVGTQIRDINNKISILLDTKTSDRLSPSQAILNILEIKDSSIKIYGVTYDATTGQERIILTGTALDRDSLANFVETLKKDPTFANVTLPISSYVKSTNIDFSVILERNQHPQVEK